jgi:spermidine synthase
MAFEIIGSRVLAPFLGASVLVWVSIIGTILFAMSAGYFVGGREADKGAKSARLASFILLAAASMCLMNLGKGYVLRFISSMDSTIIFKSVTSSVSLFSLPAFFLAAVFPYALRLGLNDLENAGKIAGRFYAMSTLGSILGTFLSATVLIPIAGTTNIIWMLAALLGLIASLVFNRKNNNVLLKLVGILIPINVLYALYPRTTIDVDSAYNRIWILDGYKNGREVRFMALNGHVNSGMFLDETQKEQVYPYSTYFLLAEHYNPNFKTALMLGAGAYSFPKLFQDTWPERFLDIVEIDPKLTELSVKHFDFRAAISTKIIHEDARTFLQNSSKNYDVIISDVFTSPIDVPFQMTTKECYQEHFDHLSENGVLILNVLGNWDGDHSAFLKSQCKTANSVFPTVFLFEVEDNADAPYNNNMLIALKSNQESSRDWLKSDNPTFQLMLDQHRPVVFDEKNLLLTDDFAPANWLLKSD